MEADRTWIDLEFDNFEYYRPSDEELARVSTPIEVLCGSDSPPFFMEAATWLAERLRTGVVVIPGNHGAHYSLPDEVAKAIRASRGGIAMAIKVSLHLLGESDGRTHYAEEVSGDQTPVHRVDPSTAGHCPPRRPTSSRCRWSSQKWPRARLPRWT